MVSIWHGGAGKVACFITDRDESMPAGFLVLRKRQKAGGVARTRSWTSRMTASKELTMKSSPNREFLATLNNLRPLARQAE